MFDQKLWWSSLKKIPTTISFTWGVLRRACYWFFYVTQVKPQWCWEPPTALSPTGLLPPCPRVPCPHQSSLSRGWQAPSSFHSQAEVTLQQPRPSGYPLWGLHHEPREQQWFGVASAAHRGALAAGRQHITPAGYDLGSGLRCIGPTSLWPARRTLWFTRGDMPVSSKNTPRREELMRAPEKDAHTFSRWLNYNQFSRLFHRSPWWMFSLGWSLMI